MKSLKILRGLPGSGKSYLAQEEKSLMEDEGWCCTIFSTDDFFIHNGKYIFNPKLIGEYHRRNYIRVHAALSDKIDCVIVDNTNVQWWEMQKYILAGLAWDYDIQFLEPDTNWAWNVEECAKRNSHGVPLETIQKMKDRYEDTAQCEIKLTQLQLLLRKFK